jgi:hypothetical protein
LVAAIFAAAASSARAAAVPRREPETDDLADAFAADFFGGEAGFFDFAGIGRAPGNVELGVGERFSILRAQS